MIFFADANLTIQKSIPRPMNQGSSEADEFVLVAPIPANSTVSVAFKLPNGVYTEPHFVNPATGKNMALVTPELIGFTDPRGNRYTVWVYIPDRLMTSLPGVLSVQFFATNIQGDTRASSLATITVGKGVPYIAPTGNATDVYDEILAYLSSVMQSEDNAEFWAKISQSYANGTIDEATAKITATPEGTTATINQLVFLAKVGYTVADKVPKEYVFTWDGEKYAWYLTITGTSGSTEVVLSEYGITLAGDPKDASELIVEASVGFGTVQPGDPGYQDNSKWYSVQSANSQKKAAESESAAEEAKNEAIAAKNDAITAKNDAITAKNDAIAAQNSAKQSADAAKEALGQFTDLSEEFGASLDMTIDNNFILAVSLKNRSGYVLSEKSVDLPIESMVVDASYNPATKEIVLTLQNGNTISVPVDDLVDGLASETYVRTYVAANTVSTVDGRRGAVTTCLRIDYGDEDAYQKISDAISKNQRIICVYKDYAIGAPEDYTQVELTYSGQDGSLGAHWFSADFDGISYQANVTPDNNWTIDSFDDKNTQTVKYVEQTLTDSEKKTARENIGVDLPNIVQTIPITFQGTTLASMFQKISEINALGEHVLFDVSALGASMYLCTIYIDTDKYKIFDLVSGRYTEGNYEASKLLTMCLVNAEGIATQSQIDHLQDEIDELGGIEKIKNWEQLGNLIESGESTNYISAGDKIDVNWIKSVNGTTTHALTVTCTSMQNFIDGVGEAEAKEYYFVFNGTAWTYNEQVIDLADWGLSVTGTVPTGEVMTIVTTVDAVNYTFTGYDDFTPVNPSVPHNWCLEQTYAPSTKAYDTYEAVFHLAPGKTLPAGNYKLHAPYYGSSPMIDIYFTIPSAFTATDKVLQFASTGNQYVACIPGDGKKYYIPSAIRPAYKNSNTYVASEISVLYNQTGDWNDISTIDGIIINTALIQSALGNNCPAHCNLRQWLNDDSATGHYKATNSFDRPSSYNFTKGFLYGIDPRVRKLMMQCKTKFTAGYNNEGYIQGQIYENKDKVFLLSMKEMSFDIQKDEGNVTDLYNEYCGNVLTNVSIAARAKYNKAGGMLNSYRWSRSADATSANNSRNVFSSGSISYYSAVQGIFYAPAFIIGKASENL